jgi:hypothetical protein
MIAPRPDVEVHSGWQAQSCHGPVAAGPRAIAQKSVVHIVGGKLKGDMRKLGARATARPGNGILRHGEIFERGSVVIETSERVVSRSSERAAYQGLAVSLHRDPDNTKTRIRVESVCQTRNAVEPGDVIARLSTDAGKQAAGKNLAVRLNRDRIDSTIRVWIEGISQAGLGVESSDVIARLSADAVRPMKIAAHQDLAVSLHRHRTDRVIRVRIESICQPARPIEARDVVSGLPANNPEIAASQDLSVRLHDNRKDKRIQKTARVRIERICQPRDSIEPGDAASRLSADIRESTARQDLAVWLDGE